MDAQGERFVFGSERDEAAAAPAGGVLPPFHLRQCFVFVVKVCMGVCCAALGYLYCMRVFVLGKSVARLRTSNALFLLA